MPIIQARSDAPIQVHNGGDADTVLLYNRDLLNHIVYGPTSGIGAGSSANINQYDIVDPLGTVVVDGSDDIWVGVLEAGQMASVGVKPGGQTWTPSPASVAQQAALVTPQITKTNIFNQAASIVTASQHFTSSIVKVNQSGYQIELGVSFNGAAATPVAELDIYWYDSLTGNTTGHEVWFLTGGTNAVQTYFGTGPVKGDQVQFVLVNWDSTIGCTFSLVLNTVSATFARDDIRGLTPLAATNGFTNPGTDAQSNFLARTAPSVNAGATTTRLLPLYAGDVYIFMSVGDTTTFEVQIQSLDQTIQSGVGGTRIYDNTRGSGGSFSDILTLPRSVCFVSLINGGTVAKTINFSLLVRETNP